MDRLIERSHLGSLGRKGISALRTLHERINRRPSTGYQTRGAGRWSGFEISQTQVLKDLFEKGLNCPRCWRIWQLKSDNGFLQVRLGLKHY